MEYGSRLRHRARYSMADLASTKLYVPARESQQGYPYAQELFHEMAHHHGRSLHARIVLGNVLACSTNHRPPVRSTVLSPNHQEHHREQNQTQDPNSYHISKRENVGKNTSSLSQDLLIEATRCRASRSTLL